MPKPLIRKATPADLSILCEISKTTFIESFADQNSEENMQSYIKSNFNESHVLSQLNNPGSDFYLALKDDQVIGYLKLNYGDAQTELKEENCIEMERIYVRKEHQGMKVGQALYEKALNIATKIDCDFIWLGVWEKNSQAIGFYKKFGFVTFDSHSFMLGNEKQTDLMMKLRLH